MIQRIKKLFHEDDGAITVDWVVLSASVIILAISGYAAVKIGTDSLSVSIAAGIADEAVY